MRVLIVGVLVAFSGCATLFSPGPDQVQVNSNPPGARVFLDNQEIGVTPMTVTLDRKNSQGSIRLEAPGYAPSATQRAKQFNPVALLNCLGVLGWVIDLVTNNYQKFDTAPVTLNLVPGYPGGPPGAPPGSWGAPPPGYPPPPPPPGGRPPASAHPQQPYAPQYPPGPYPQYPQYPPQPQPQPR